MALETALITGTLQGADGEAGSEPQLIFRLSAVDTQNGIVVTRSDRVADLGEAGAMPDGFDLAKNTAMLRGTWYEVFYSETTDVGGAPRRRPPELIGRIQIGDEDSYSIADLLDNPVPAVSSWNINLMQSQFWRARGAVNPLDFGVTTGDDDTALVRSAHELANSLNVPVSLVGIADLYVQANAQFDAQTPLDGAGCVVHFVDGIVTLAGGSGDEELDDDLLSFSDALSCWVFNDPATPLVETLVGVGDGAGQIAATSLWLRSQAPSLGHWSEAGYLKIESGGSVVAANRRAAPGTMKYRQAFSLSEHGKALIGLHADLRDDTSVTIWRRANSTRGQLWVRDLTLDISDANALRALNFTRNGCNVSGLTVVGETETFTRHNLLRYDDVCDQRIQDLNGRAFLNDPNKASRLINVVGGANFDITGIRGFHGWGIVGTQQTQGVRYTDCDLNRADIHQWGGDIKTDGCRFAEWGVTFGVVTGDIEVVNCDFHAAKAAIAKRKDWAGETFDSVFKIDDITIREAEGETTVIDIATSPAGSTETACRLPEIRVRGVERLGKPGDRGATTTIKVVNIKVSATSLDVLAPEAIVIDDVVVPVGGRVQALAWPQADLEPSSSGAVTAVTISHTRARDKSSFGNLAGATVYTWPSGKSATGVAAAYRLDDCDKLSVETPADRGATTYWLTDCDVCRLNVGSSRRVDQDGCMYGDPLFASPETKAPVAGVAGAGTGANYTSIQGGRVTSSDFDFANAMVIAGLLTRSAQTPTWPSGCTSDLAWTGFKAGAF